MATHARIPAWRIPWTEELGGLQPMGLQSWTQLKQLSTHACMLQYMQAGNSLVVYGSGLLRFHCQGQFDPCSGN